MESKSKTVSVNELPSVDIFAKISFEKFKSLPKTGKSFVGKEWTVISTIIQLNENTNETKVVAIGTGTKCIGHNQLCKNGFILNDSHAEIIARRTFLRYIYENLLECNNFIENLPNNIFIYDETKFHFELKNYISFHFFSSHLPCGDATIPSKVKESNGSDEMESKRRKIENENYVFTGAKLIDDKFDDVMNQEEGAIRTKPGRGERTLSMSCSDKISRWNLIGIQGALLDTLLKAPIFLKSLNFCGISNDSSLQRTFNYRKNRIIFKNSKFNQNLPQIRITNSINFEFEYSENKTPSPASIAWCDLTEDKKPFEVSICGKKQGLTKKNLMTQLGALEISKFNLFQLYKKVLLKFPNMLTKISLDKNIKNNSILSYFECKKNSIHYQDAWELAKTEYFGNWTKKSKDFLNFRLDFNEDK